eukprot:CAMPEP_0176187328 /NCGR_PEP_ID=MMETSP0121_2-20121125/2336_1 /TAXON_ID=160619 /ORGANISM="Kryptoperidinium foliaceum, Strain CCMP 1326" /LENGTH=58 /DNA_ID=CAMNT_0017525855 /DNA_START=35 /DNA_END=208 /DNA_ORIENTATION=-
MASALGALGEAKIGGGRRRAPPGGGVALLSEARGPVFAKDARGGIIGAGPVGGAGLAG